MKDSGLPWIGEIPATWRCLRGKYALEYLQKPVEDTDGVITCFRDGEVTLRSNRREDGFTISEKEIGYQGIDVGDLVVHGMDGFAGSIGISDSRGKASPVLVVLNSKENKRFLMYYLRNMAYSDVFLALATGIRVRSCDLRWNKLAETIFALPPIQEQNAIVSYIDKKTAEIDAAINETKSLIDKYKAYKQSIITEAVTKGMNPNVKMKDSGIEWIGEIPDNWKVVPFRSYVINRSKKNKGEKTRELLALSYALGVTLYRDKVFNMDRVKENYEDYQLVYKDDLVLSPNDIIKGSIYVSKYYGCISPMYLVFSARNPNTHYLPYLSYLLRTKEAGLKFFFIARGLIGGISNTGTYVTRRMTVSTHDLLTFKVLLPPIEQQLSIVNYLDTKCSQIDTIISQKEHLVTQLQEYKKSIIFEYVTGKKEVPNAQ